MKPSCHGLWGFAVWGILAWAILLYIKLCILCTFSIPVCLHPPDHLVFPLLYGAELNWSKSFWKVCLECFKCIIAMLLQVFIDCTPEEASQSHKMWALGPTFSSPSFPSDLPSPAQNTDQFSLQRGPIGPSFLPMVSSFILRKQFPH